MSSKLMFGLPDDEYLHDNIQAVLEQRLDDGAPLGDVVTVEHRMSIPNRKHLPNAATVAREVAYDAGDGGEVMPEWTEAAFKAAEHPDVLRFFEQALMTLADRIGWHMAGKKVAESRWRLDADGWVRLDEDGAA